MSKSQAAFTMRARNPDVLRYFSLSGAPLLEIRRTQGHRIGVYGGPSFRGQGGEPQTWSDAADI
ncbi:MAG: hypothetical protein ACRENX_03130 [Candidatus Dormibacteria bacterium]